MLPLRRRRDTAFVKRLSKVYYEPRTGCHNGGMKHEISAFLGSVLLLTGAFTIGWVLHQIFQGTISIINPVVFVGTIIGFLLIAIGYRLEKKFSPEDYIIEGGKDSAENTGYDGAFSPVEDPWLEDYDQDDGES